ncbi:MAG: hypothetical protein R3C56_28780 [Pirellulaceae bacterium]
MLLAYSLCGTVTAVGAQDAQWIWTPEHPRGAATEGDCYFRKTMQLSSVERSAVTITADDQYELFVNGRKIGTGNSIRQMEQYDVSGLLVRGRNVIGVRNEFVSRPSRGGARVLVQPKEPALAVRLA